jgi:hypothetical protein
MLECHIYNTEYELNVIYFILIMHKMRCRLYSATLDFKKYLYKK